MLQKHQSCKIKIRPMKPSVSNFIGSVFPRSSEFLGCPKNNDAAKMGMVSSISNELNPCQTLTHLAHLFGQMFILHCFHFLAVTTLSSKMVVGRRRSFLGVRPFFKGRFFGFVSGKGYPEVKIFNLPTSNAFSSKDSCDIAKLQK